MKKILRFQAEAGRIFNTALECTAYEQLCELKKWYEHNNIYDTDWGDLLAWLRKFPDQVTQLLVLVKTVQ